MNNLLEKIENSLNSIKQLQNFDQALFDKNYFKSPMNFWGVSKKNINEIGKKLYKEIKSCQFNDIVIHFDSLWQSKSIHEIRTLTIVTLSYFKKDITPDICNNYIFKWLLQCHSWDHVDELCIKVIGAVGIKNAEFFDDISKLKSSDYMWVRRASLLCHLPSIRKGIINFNILNKTCIDLAVDNDFFIRKAIGWVLREVSQKSINISVDIINNIGTIASNLTIREATRKLPEDIKNELLTKYIKKKYEK